MNEILGCAQCGFVSRSDGLDGTRVCPECGTPIGPVSLEEARRYVATRKRNAERGRAQAAAAEVGLSETPDLS